MPQLLVILLVSMHQRLVSMRQLRDSMLPCMRQLRGSMLPSMRQLRGSKSLLLRQHPMQARIFLHQITHFCACVGAR